MTKDTHPKKRSEGFWGSPKWSGVGAITGILSLIIGFFACIAAWVVIPQIQGILSHDKNISPTNNSTVTATADNNSQEAYGDCSQNIKDSSNIQIQIDCNTYIDGEIVDSQPTPVSQALLKAKISYFTEQTEGQRFNSLRAKVDEQEYRIIDEKEELCLVVSDQKDYDGNGLTDVLVKQTACGGNCCANRFFFVSYLGDGYFQRSSAFGYSWNDPEIQKWKRLWSVLVTSRNEGINTDAAMDIRERFILDAGQVVRVESSERKEIIALIELRAEQFDIQKDDEVKVLSFDLDNDGVKDKIIGRLWTRWGRIQWSVEFSQGKVSEGDMSCKRLGVLDTKTEGVNDIVCDQDYIYEWDGDKYINVP